MEIKRIFYAIAGATILLAVFMLTSGGVRAQEPEYDVTAWEDGIEKEPWTWYTISDLLSLDFYATDPYTITVEWLFSGSGGATNLGFCQAVSNNRHPTVAFFEPNSRWDTGACTTWNVESSSGISDRLSGSECKYGTAGGISARPANLWGATCDPWSATVEGTSVLTVGTLSDLYPTIYNLYTSSWAYYASSGLWTWRWYPSAPISQTEPITSDYCTDGTELISDVVTLELGETWTSGDVLTEWDYIQARYTISNPMPAGQQRLYGTAYFNDSTYVWSPDLYPHPVTSFTIPSAFRYNSEPNGPTVTTSLLNTGYDFDILSVCLVPYTRTVLPQNCHLDNYSFADGTTGWTVLDGLYEWLESEEDGAVSLESVGLASQVVTLTGSFKMQVRARASGSSASFQFGGYELDFPFESEAVTETATADYAIYETYVYLNGQSNISIHSNSDDTIIDWVCLSGSDTGGVPWQFPIPDCTFPTFDDHPDFAITEIGNWIAWLAQKFGELIAWLVCEIFVIMFTIANAILAAIRAIGDFTGIPDFPAFPDEITFDSVLEWFRQCFVSFFSWLGMNFKRLRDAIPVVAEWFWSLLLAVLGWVAEKLLLPAVTWLMQHVLEALGIGEDAMVIARAIWRDLSVFVAAAAIEAGYEFESLTLLLTETAGVFGILITGFRGVATGTSELDFGEELNGLAAYLWRGVEFINESVSLTPLSALNIVALGVITIGLAQWTISRLLKMLERLS